MNRFNLNIIGRNLVKRVCPLFVCFASLAQNAAVRPSNNVVVAADSALVDNHVKTKADSLAVSLFDAFSRFDTLKGKPYVDLGLSVKWAAVNVGASQFSDDGDFVAWGETSSNEKFDWQAYKLCAGNDATIKRYKNSDKQVTLNLDDDFAAAAWGEDWRMPTEDEFLELQDGCYWSWVEVDGVDDAGFEGLLGTSKENGNIIFFPATVFVGANEKQYVEGSCWTSSVYKPKKTFAVHFFFDVRHDGSISLKMNALPRCYGRPVRAVAK